MIRTIACVGREATSVGVEEDLGCGIQERFPRGCRISIARTDGDLNYLRGLSGDEVLWIDMDATMIMHFFCRQRRFTVGTIDDAKKVIAEWRRDRDSNPGHATV